MPRPVNYGLHTPAFILRVCGNYGVGDISYGHGIRLEIERLCCAAIAPSPIWVKVTGLRNTEFKTDTISTIS